MPRKQTNYRRPGPGIYRDVPFWMYRRWPMVNNSSLPAALISGKNYEHWLTTPADEPSDEQILGSVVHVKVLQPDLHDQLVAVQPDFTANLLIKYDAPWLSNEYKQAKAKWYAQQGDLSNKLVIKEADNERAAIIASNVRDYLRKRLRLTPRPDAELALVAKCPQTGLRLKCLIDLLPDDEIIDLKTSRRPHEFPLDIDQWDYYRQGRFYQRMVFYRKKKWLPVRYVVAGTSPPYEVVSALMPQEAMEARDGDINRALRRIAQGARTNEWQGLRETPYWRLPWDNAVDLKMKDEIKTFR